MKPSSFSTICTEKCAHELVGLLLSLSVFHTGAKIYIIADSKTKQIIDDLTPIPKLKINWQVDLDKYTGMDRLQMLRENIFGEFLTYKMKVMHNAIQENPDTLFLDSDIIVTDIIDDIDPSKSIGLSPQFITQAHVAKTGYFNAGMLWTSDKRAIENWRNVIDMKHDCPEQINMSKIIKGCDYFEFGENYNLQCWRLYLSNETSETIASHITSKPNIGVFYKGKPLKFIHTHFLDKRFDAFNTLLIDHFKNARAYKILAIIYRVINQNWILRLPKQPMAGMGGHNNDSYREMPILLKFANKDVDIKYDERSIHCWLEPNILTYDRDTLEHCDQEVARASLFLLGNGDVLVEGKELGQYLPDLPIQPWIFWPRHPMLVEKLLKKHGILDFNDREIGSIFIGNFENSVQEKYRKTDVDWASALDEFHCTAGFVKKFTSEEYLMKLRGSKYGLCLRGYGTKCNREIELMAFGTVPIVTQEVTVFSYMEPFIENIHFLRASCPEEVKQRISETSEEKWRAMSNTCYDWYQRNVHSKQAWNTMINRILYSKEV